MKLHLGPEPTERQQEQIEATEAAAKILRAAGINCRVTYFVCGEKFPNADAAAIFLEIAHDRA